MPGKRADGIKVRGIPVPDALWKPAIAKAASRGESLSEVLRQALREYVKS